MSLRKNMKRYRRALMKRITRNFAATELAVDHSGLPPVAVERVLICRPNHRLGNLLLITPLLQEVERLLPGAKVDLFVKGDLAQVLFKHYTNVDRIISLPKKPLKSMVSYVRAWLQLSKSQYDIVVNVVNHSSSGRIAARLSRSHHKFLGDITPEIELQVGDFIHMGKYSVYSFRAHLRRLGIPAQDRRVPPLNLKLSSDEIAVGRRMLAEVAGAEPHKVICLYTFATGEKRYPPAWWEEFHRLLVAAFPAYTCIEVLPKENVSQLSFNLPHFYSTNLREIGAMLANASLFIGGDSGMMHLASASGVATVGLFQTTKMNVYAPYNDDSIGVDTRNTDLAGCVEAVRQILEKREGKETLSPFPRP